jgi:micrococcal nuclease
MRTAVLIFVLTVAAPCVALADPCTADVSQLSPDESFDGTARYIVDGDGLCVGRNSDPSTWIEVRLADFYAPELSSPEGPRAKAALQSIVRGRNVTCRVGRQSYDRIVAWCEVDGVSLGDRMRAAGIREGGRGREDSSGRRRLQIAP